MWTWMLSMRRYKAPATTALQYKLKLNGARLFLLRVFAATMYARSLLGYFTYRAVIHCKRSARMLPGPNVHGAMMLRACQAPKPLLADPGLCRHIETVRCLLCYFTFDLAAGALHEVPGSR